MAGLLEKIKSRSSNIKAQRDTFVSKLRELNETLSESLNGIDIQAQSDYESLAMSVPDHEVYGCLSFRYGELKVAYRSTEDDLRDAANRVPYEYQTYQLESIHSCPVAWLEKLSSESQINRLLSNIEKSLESIECNTIGSIESLNKALDSQSEEISKETIEALREANADELIKA